MKRILVIEDNREMSRVYERAFRLSGYEVDVAYDGEAALKAMASGAGKPSAIILDINMPKVSGYAFLERIKGDPATRDIPVAVLTNSYTKEDADRFMSIGADLYLVKIEQNFTEIAGKIDKMIEDRKKITT